MRTATRPLSASHRPFVVGPAVTRAPARRSSKMTNGSQMSAAHFADISSRPAVVGRRIGTRVPNSEFYAKYGLSLRRLHHNRGTMILSYNTRWFCVVGVGSLWLLGRTT